MCVCVCVCVCVSGGGGGGTFKAKKLQSSQVREVMITSEKLVLDLRCPTVFQLIILLLYCNIFSTVILSLLLIHEGQLSVSSKRMCTNTA